MDDCRGAWQVREVFKEEVMFVSLRLETWAHIDGMCWDRGREEKSRGRECQPQTRTQCWGTG